MSWAMTQLEILGIKLDFMAQTASITSEHQQCILQSCSQVLHQGRASLLELQQIAGHLQFVMHIAPHGHAFLHWLYNAVQAHYKAPFGRCISKPTRDELSWWISTLQSWDSISLLQPSPLLVAHIWTDTSKHCIGAHLGTMDNPEAVFSHELGSSSSPQGYSFPQSSGSPRGVAMLLPTLDQPSLCCCSRQQQKCRVWSQKRLYSQCSDPGALPSDLLPMLTAPHQLDSGVS